MRRWRAVPAWSIIALSSTRPERCGASRTGWLQSRPDVIVAPTPQLDSATEAAREAVLDAIRRHLQSWLDFFSGDQRVSATAAETVALTHSLDDVRRPLRELGSRLEASGFARLESWTIDQRRAILAELQSMRRLEVLISDLNRWLAQIPGSATPLVS